MKRTAAIQIQVLVAAAYLTSPVNSLAFSVVDRRRALATAFGASSAAALVVASSGSSQYQLIQSVLAVDSAPTQQELDRIVQGYKQINYLLDHFDEETTVCKEGGGGKCKRDSDAIRRALGLRTTTDPLFQIDKVFAKIKNMDSVDPDKLPDIFEATEDWNGAMAMSNSMAYVSQFGEYNPGGGEDNVLKYLLEAKKQVVSAQTALKTIVEALDLKVA